MKEYAYPSYAPASGYLTEKIRQQYIENAVAKGVLPENAHRMEHILSLTAPDDISKPIQFWQLYSVLGQHRIVDIVKRFYERVYTDEKWFSSVFAGIAGMNQHINAQSAMWIDVMGGGLAYHGGEYRLSFHHSHNAIRLMTDKGARKWVQLMVATLDDPEIDLAGDERVRAAINTFLGHFMAKYADEFGFSNTAFFGNTNPPIKRRVNFMNMTSDAIEALSKRELTEALVVRGVDVSQYKDKSELVNKALRL